MALFINEHEVLNKIGKINSKILSHKDIDSIRNAMIDDFKINHPIITSKPVSYLSPKRTKVKSNTSTEVYCEFKVVALNGDESIKELYVYTFTNDSDIEYLLDFSK